MEKPRSTTESIFNKLAFLDEKEDQLLKKRESLFKYQIIFKFILFVAILLSIFFIIFTVTTEGKIVLSITLSLCISIIPTIGLLVLSYLINQTEKKLDKISNRTSTLLDILDKRKQRS